MTIEHKNIVDPNQHEPKGAAAANADQMYIADGAGSGAFKDNAHNTHAEMAIIAKSQAFTPTGTNITDDANYIKITAASLWESVHADNVTFNVDELAVGAAGDYFISTWISFSTAAAAGSVFGIRYAINDTTPYSTRTLIGSKNSTGTDRITLSATGIVTSLAAQDTISLYIASDVTTNLTITDAGLTAFLLHPDN